LAQPPMLSARCCTTLRPSLADTSSSSMLSMRCTLSLVSCRRFVGGERAFPVFEASVFVASTFEG
jgi:hypothetical protein